MVCRGQENPAQKSLKKRADNVLTYMDDLEKIQKFAYNLVYYIFWLIEIILGFRFLFKLLGANPNNAFVSLFYSPSKALVAPFVDMFKYNVSGQIVFEPYTIIAMLVYAIVTHLILLLIKKLTMHYNHQKGPPPPPPRRIVSE